MKHVKFSKTTLLLLCAVLLFSACSGGFADAEAYSEQLKGEGYSVYIISDENSGAPDDILLLKFVLEHAILAEDASLNAEKALLASNNSATERICIFYYNDEKTAESAANALKKQDEQLNKLFGTVVSREIQINGQALKIKITEAVD